MEFAPVEGHAVVAAFDGGAITSDAGALLLGAADRRFGWSSALLPASPTAAAKIWWNTTSPP
jgi:hypothetical protein